MAKTTMRADNSAAIVAAARARRTDTTARAAAAIRHLDETGSTINFSTVALAASVSRAWLYRDPTTRAEITRLRSRTQPKRTPLPSAQHASEESLQQRLETAHDEITRLRDDNHRLREQLASDLGARRASHNDHSPR